MLLDDEKPLLPYQHSPSSSRSSSPPPLSPRLSGISSTSPLARFLSSRRRWIALVTLYLLVFFTGLFGVAWSPFASLSFRRLPPGRLVFDAYGRAFSTRPTPFHPAHPPSPSGPSTSLGRAADDVFHLFPSADSPSPAILLTTLECFLRTHFPPADSDPSNPHSLLNALRSYFPSPSEPAANAQIPHKIWQTAPDERYFEMKRGMSESWERANPAWEVERHDNARADEWVCERFALDKGEGEVQKRDRGAVQTAFGRGQHEENGGEGQQEPLSLDEEAKGVVAAWDRLATPAVLRSDFWRYLVLAVEGGVYADTDVECLHPVEKWGEDVSWEGKRPADYIAPSLIVGIEADVGSRHDWHDWWPRPLQISQWTIASARGHPVLLDVVRRIVEMALLPEEEQPKSVMERTGPGPFTDSLLSYLLSHYRKPWGTLRGLTTDGWRFRASRDAPELLERRKAKGVELGEVEERWGDVKVLSITGFSPGVGHMGAKGRSDPAAMAAHNFAGSWRLQQGADA
ncbi:hypothetical protein JCM6882_001932 [Rhodosporidiobolus microsporus]